MAFDITQIVRKNIQHLQPYNTARDDFDGNAIVFLDANENPFPGLYNRYPDPKHIKLKKEIARIKRVDVRSVFIGNGSDEVIDLLIRVFCQPAIDNVIIPQPTYGMYHVCAKINDIEVRQPLLTSDFQPNTRAILGCVDSRSKIIFLCSPNNPSGNLLNEKDLLLLLKSFDGIVAIDEAYIDFAKDPGMLQYLGQFPNLFIMQTLSKAWGLAGLRVGLGFGSSEIIEILTKVKPPYNLSTASQSPALQSLFSNVSLESTKQSIAKEKEELVKNLLALSFVKKVHPSDANFLLVEFANANSCYNFLLDKGIVVRDRSNLPHCKNCLRITVGTESENIVLIEALKEFENKVII